MAYFYRLILCNLLFLSNAFALIPQVGTQIGWIEPSSGTVAPMATPCWAIASLYDKHEKLSETSTNALFRCTYTPNGAYQDRLFDKQFTYSCPANSSLSNGSCLCTLPNVENSSHTACEVVCEPPKRLVSVITDTGVLSSCSLSSCKAGASGIFVERIRVGGVMPSTSFECVAGCVAKTDFSFGIKYTDGNGVVQDKAVGETVFLGGACATSTADASTAQKPAPIDSATNPNSAKTAKCPVGQSPKFVNGLEVCSPVGLADETTTSKTTSSTDAAGNKTDVISTTKCVGSTCTTSTATTVTPNGGSSATTTKEDTKDKTTFCQDNPTLSICKEGSFSGSCGSFPTCTGDAVMCAVAASSFATNCALTMPDTSPENSAYDLAKTKTGDQTGALPGNSSLTVGPADFDGVNILGAAAGMHDVSITVAGQSINLPFSSINPWLDKLGSLLQAVTFLVCAFIVTGNKQGGAA